MSDNPCSEIGIPSFGHILRMTTENPAADAIRTAADFAAFANATAEVGGFSADAAMAFAAASGFTWSSGSIRKSDVGWASVHVAEHGGLLLVFQLAEHRMSWTLMYVLDPGTGRPVDAWPTEVPRSVRWF